MIAVLLAGCEKSAPPAPPPPAKPAEAAPPAAAAPERDLQTIKVTLPEGWTKKDYGDRDFVLFETPLPDGRTANMRITRATAKTPTNARAYVDAKLASYWDKGVVAKILAEEPLPGGFGATLSLMTPSDPQRPKLEYHAVRDAGDQHLHCECEWAPDEKIRDQVAALCKSASW
jgi:hypothetical protein